MFFIRGLIIVSFKSRLFSTKLVNGAIYGIPMLFNEHKCVNNKQIPSATPNNPSVAASIINKNLNILSDVEKL